MQLTTDHQHRTLWIAGTLNIEVAKDLSGALLEAIAGQEQGAPTPLTLNLSQVESCDTSALQILLSARKHAESLQRSLRFDEVPHVLTATASALGISFGGF